MPRSRPPYPAEFRGVFEIEAAFGTLVDGFLPETVA
jgi:hypothetical protein